MSLIAHLTAIAETRRALWIDSALYVQRVLAKGHDLPWDDTAAFVALSRKQQQLVQSDVLTIDIGEYYRAVLNARSELVQAMGVRSRANYAL